MAEGQVSQFFNLDGIRGNRDAAIALVREGVTTMNDLQKSIVNNNTVSGNAENAEKAASGMKNLTASLKEYIAQNQRLIDIEAKLSQATSDDAKALAAYRVELAATNKQLKEEATLASNLTGAYDKLVVQHKQLTKAYLDAAAAGKSSNAELTILKDRANEVGGQLAKMNQAIGNYRANVGNYSSAWNGLGNAINQVGRELPNFAQSLQLGFLAISNNLPILADEISNTRKRIAELKAEGKDAPSLFSQIAKSVFSWQTVMVIGIGILVKYGAQITDMVSKLVSASDEAAKAQELLNKAYSSQEVVQAIANVNQLREDIQLAKEGFLDKNDVVKEYNQTIGKTAGEVLSLDEAEKELNKNADAYIKFTLYKAAANYAFEESAKKSVDALLTSQKALKAAAGITPGGGTNAIASLQVLFGGLSAKNAKEEADQLLDIGETFRRKMAEVGKENGFGLFPDDKTRTKKQQDLTNELLSARRKEIDEQRKLDAQRLQEEIDAQEAIYTNDQVAFEKRIQALDLYVKAKEKLIQLEYDSQVEETAVALAKIAQIESKAVKDRTNEEKVLLTQKKAYQIEKLRLDEEEVTKQLKNDSDGQKKRLIILKDFSEEQYKIIMKGLNDIRLEGEKNGQREAAILQNQINYLSELSKAYGLNVESRAKLAEFITNLQIKQTNVLNDEEEKLDKKRKERAKKNARILMDAAKETFDYTMSLLKAQAENEIADLEKRKDRLTEEYDLKNKAVDESYLNDKEKQEQKAVLDAEEAERMRQINEEIKQQKRNQAIADKANALFSIAINTASKIVQVAPNPLAIAAIATLGAAQAATVLATPIPAYAEGKDEDDPYTGKALIGEAGPELWVDHKGRMRYITSPTIIDTVKGDTVLNQQQIAAGAALPYLQSEAPRGLDRETREFYHQEFHALGKQIQKTMRGPLVIDNSRYFEASKSASR